MSIFLLFGASVFVYFLVYRPEVIGILLFSLIISEVNVKLPGMPLNLRAIVTIAIFIRILFDKKNSLLFRPFFNLSSSWYFLMYNLYILFISEFYDLLTFELLKQTFSIFMAVYCVYYFFTKYENGKQLKQALIISGLLCFADLAYTYLFVGYFPVIRVYEEFLTGQTREILADDMNINRMNHNFFGQVCGMCFIYLFSDFIINRTKNKFLLFLMPLMFLGILLSTSRSALVACIVLMIIIMINGIKFREQKKRIYRVIFIGLGSFLLGILFLSIVINYLKLDSQFAERIVFRLVDEPIAMINKAFGYSYNIQNLDSGEWRAEAAANAFAAFWKLHIKEQLFGIGIGGYVSRNLSEGLDPHNGLLLILIETGFIGLCFYVFFILGSIWRSLKLKGVTPTLAVLVFIIVYGMGQNGEMTSPTTFLFVFNLVAETELYLMSKRRMISV